MATHIDTPVLIIGGGPSGTMMAVQLQRAGVDFVIVERDECITPKAKGQALTMRTMETFTCLGLDQAILEKCPVTDVTIRQIYLDGLGGNRKLAQVMLPGMHPLPDLSACCGVRLPQNLTQQTLADDVVNNGGNIMFGWTATSTQVLEPAEEGGQQLIESTLTRENGETMTVTSRYVVAADGGSSDTRKRLGLTMEGEAAMMMVLAFEVESQELTDRFMERGDAVMYSVVGGPQKYRAVCSMTYSKTTWHINVFGPGCNEVDVNDAAATRALLFAALEGEVECEITACYRWSVHKLFSSIYTNDNQTVFLAGDAAHMIPPAAGLNMNVGLEDSVNLGWKLGAVINGWAPEALLTSYTSERAPWAAHTAERSAYMTSVMMPILRDFPPRQYADEFQEKLVELWEGKAGLDLDVRYDDSAIVVPDASIEAPAWDCGAVFSGVRAGHRAPHVQLGCGKSLPLMLPRGSGFALIMCDRAAQDLTQQFAEAASAVNMPMEVMDFSNEDDPEVLETYGALTLVRPDGFVAWTCPQVGQEVNAARVVDIVRGAGAGPV